MQSLALNKQKIYYALFTGMTDAVDSQGYKTGEKVKTYADPVELKINISPSRGTADTEQFGINLDYDRTMVTADMHCPIAEDTIVWFGVPATEPHNYVVKAVARSLNSIVYAIKEVKVK